MGWNVLFLLHLFCAMAGVHSQGNATKEDVIHNQAFEGEAVHSMMRAWVDAGTSPDVFSWLGWPFEEHPCANPNSTRFFYFGITCSTRSYQLEDSNSSLVQIHTLTGLYLEDYLYARDKPLVGGLPPAIVNLTNLETLFIKNATKLSGPLPTGLFCSSILQSISLTNCSFNGSIISGFGPSCGGNEELQRLDLLRNSFTKMIPFPFNDVHPKFFSKLQYLNVSYNQIKREFASVTVNLEIVDISNNFITNIVYLGQNIIFSSPLKSIYAQINSIKTFPSEIFKHKALQDINLDSNNISSIAQISSNINDSTIQKISMSKNKFQLFPEVLLQLPNLEELILDSNHITGDLHMPNMSCQYSKIKLISLLYNGITHFYPSNDNTSCFSESRILSDNKIFLGGNPICTNQSFKARVLQLVCRFNASSPIIEVEELIIVKKSNKILQIIIVCVSSVVVALFIMGFFVIQKLKKKISLLHEIQSEFDRRDVKPNLHSYSDLKVATQDFHTRNELGRGGFGIVYKVYL